MTVEDKVLLAASSRVKSQVAVGALKTAGLAGERIEVLIAGEDTRDLEERAARAAGLVLLGGPDIDPRAFGEEPLPEARLAIHPERDELERRLFEGARAARVPVWGICRGMQVVNVFFGGTLWQDLPTQLAGSMLHDLSYPRDALVHTIEVVDHDTPLGELLARETALVNSRHHQGVKEIAPGFRIVGRAPDGLVEAMVLDRPDWWMELVQWHPENLIPMAQQRAIAERFLAAVDEYERAKHALDPHADAAFVAG